MITFGRVAVYAPTRAPDQVVLFISGDGGWNLGVVPMAERLRDLGALVVGIDMRTFSEGSRRLKGLRVSGCDASLPESISGGRVIAGEFVVGANVPIVRAGE